MSELTQRIVNALRERFDRDQYALVSEVSLGERRADAVAASFWRSDDHHLIGFEIKTRRDDWLRELRQPEKAAAFTPYCTRFYLVSTPDVAKREELPRGWGWIVVTLADTGDVTRVARPARTNPAMLPTPRELWTSMLRQALKVSPLGNEFERGVRAGIMREKQSLANQRERVDLVKRKVDNERYRAEWRKEQAREAANTNATEAKEGAA